MSGHDGIDPQAEDERQQRAAMLAEQFKEFLSGTSLYTAPSVTSPQYRHQVELNAEVINLVLSKNPDRDQLIVTKLKERNTLLSVAELNPSVFKVTEQMKSIASLGKGHEASAMLTAALVASTMTGQQPPEKRKRPNPDRPFRQRGVEAAYSTPPAYPQAFPAFAPQPSYYSGFPRAGGSGFRGGARQRSSPPCFNCGESGHFMSTCPNKRYRSSCSFSLS